IGAIFAPLNWRLVADELAYIVRDCGSKVLICGPEFTETLAAMLPNIDVDHLISVEGAEIAGALVYEDELAKADEEEPERPFLHPDDTACILYTSGTTGKPKGAMIPHRQIVWNAINTVVSWGLTQDDISPIFTPMFHSGGLFVFLTPLFYVGGRIVLMRQFDPVETLRQVAEEKCTVLLGVPTIFQMWLNTPALAETDFSAIRWFISGGAPCPVSLIAAWRQATGKPFRQGYGLTEVGTNCFTMTDEESLSLVGSVGRPIFHSQMRLADPEGHNVPLGETGELLIKGPHITSGYWQNPEATASSIVDGWFKTGDMARQDQNGYFYIVGRFKDMIISGGENIYAAEVEAVFREHPAVLEAALIGQPDEKWGEIGLMITVLEKGRSATAAELRAFCKERLASYKVPKQVIFVNELPYSPYGKVEKIKLKQTYVTT
ncbi:MAG: AMP-binding protein, partial [Anaerolineales bacterium]|nr:AMP-binding protein [Anaerolineales bacterium]